MNVDNLDITVELIEAACGTRELDLIIHDTQVVNVFTGEINTGSIGIYNGMIVSPNFPDQAKAKKIFEGKHLFALPGLIDTHVHIDSTLLTPSALAGLITPCGTTAVFPDPMEIAT